jgi:acyl-CoA reductase-like NAD-dependent aldehyde dehydrogenase
MSWGRPNSIRQLVNWLTSTVTGGGSRQPCRVIAYAGSPVTLQSSPITNAVFSMAPAVKPRIFLSDQSSDRALQEASIEETVIAQLNRARTVQAEWAESRMRDRIAVLKSLRLRIAQDPRGLARSVNRENAAETLAAEVLPLLDACRFLELEAPKLLREKSSGNRARPMWLWGTRVVLRPEPLGVVLIIAPSNYPLMLPGIQALQAVAAGNAVLIKPAVGGTAAVQALIKLAESCGLLSGLIQVLPESPSAAAIVIREGIDKVFLTGSAATGQAVGRELANSTTPAVMELSGCDAVFILKDADPELVSDCLLFGLTLNQSQTCMAPRRVFLSDEMAEKVLNLLLKKLAARQSQAARAGNSPASRLAAKRIEEAIQHGAQLLSGSIEPINGEAALQGVAILDRVTADMAITTTDLFAPVLSFIRVASDEDALRENVRCPYALSATVFGTTQRCHDLARRIHAGCVVINDIIVPTADPRVPFGGRGKSGYGMTRGEAGLLEMTQLKAIVSTRRWFKPHLHAPTPADADVMEQLIRLEHASSPLQKLLIVPQMIKTSLSQLKFRRSPGVRES